MISIVTVVLNGAASLEQSIKSVIEQSYENTEYIVIDGGSTDGSLQIIDRHRDRIDHTVTEPDRGIADAMNKGIRLASGDYLIFLHADDFFAGTSSLAEAAACFDDLTDLYLCDIRFGKERKLMSPRGFNFWMNFKTGVFHQGAICKRRIFDEIGTFDTEYRIAMDYDFFLRAYRNGFKAKKCPATLSVMGDAGISSSLDWTDLRRRFKEEKSIHWKHCPSTVMKFLYRLYWLLYLPYRKLKSRSQG